ncbi:MAG TPA: murein biosynthesis integral membrane protein MurJ [Vicinamibacteria bacterium]|nr:murein biosynthesis integral membrane protein MurJ [Vicinamibacteria bacterium]
MTTTRNPHFTGHSARGQGALRSAGLVSLLILCSRILGVVREQVFAAVLGAGMHADAYQIGFRIPNLLRDLFAEGALSAAFVPSYARAAREGGRATAQRLASRVLTLLGVVLGALVLAGLLGAHALVATLAPGFDAVPGKAELTVLLTRIMLPFLPLVSFAAVAMGMLNAEERYGPPAFAPAMFNVVAIAVGATLWLLGWPIEEVVVGWAGGTLLGGLAQFLVQVPALRAQGFRFRPEWAPRDPGIRRLAALMGPATAGLAAVQVNIFVNSIFASHEPGAVSWLSYAFRILYLPIGLFGVAAGTVAATGLAKRAAQNDMEGLRDTLRLSLRMLAFLTVPATAGLLVLGVPIVRLLFERGRFTPHDTERTAAALAFYGAGLVAYAAVKVLAPAFYALGAPRIPLIASVLAVATNLLLNLALYDRLGFRSVALGTSVAAVVNAAALAVAFERRVGGLWAQGFGPGIGRMVLAAAGMAPVAWLSSRAIEGAMGLEGLPAQAATALVPVAAGVVAYFGAALALGLPEARRLVSAVWRRAWPC